MAVLVTTTRDAWAALRRRIARYLANDDALTQAANAGAFLVWSSQPLYPLYVAALVGRDAWPSLLTWLSTPLFAAVPIVARSRPRMGRALFVVAGVANTLLSTKAFGTASAVAWFFVPCGMIALLFYRRSDWRLASGLVLLVGIAAVAAPHLGPPLHAYSAAQYRSLSHLNLWSVVVLSAYLAYAAVQARRRA